ncbi:NADP-dependent malic enzyme [hydrothermal vent metagenome]|uniref:NADP-dependent malic enzyme n=1 Tax=hydrothermal vent metagenome TaxID=652676 RepID=A0A3B1C7D3_9ZZZZ
MSITREEALRYHSEGRKGKVEVTATKPCYTARELSLAYTPGVAEPCREIEKNENDVYEYTAKGNLVAVVSNGTAVLGLGNIGPAASKPVMEGKGVLFKRFADIDVFDLELKTEDPKEIIRAVQLLEPTFGGINLEDIKAPECFEIERELKKTMDIPVFHDDQHGTAIISCAALINAAEIAGKKLEDMKLVVVGAGAAGIACSNLYVTAGVKQENISMFDSKGHIHKGRTDINKYKQAFAQDEKLDSLEDALNGADAFLGLSKGGLLTKEMVKGMNDTPIIFAMANPDPEITYPDAVDARPDVIMATGRSDYPNQVNNVLGFPFIFRGALDVKARAITEEMKMAAVHALADLAKEDVPDVVLKAYSGQDFEFGREYIIPKPFDPRVLWRVAPAVAKAAIESGVARTKIENWHEYEEQLKERLGFSQEIVRLMVHKAVKNPKRVVYPEGEEEKIIKAANTVAVEGIGSPILLGREEKILKKIDELGFDAINFKIIDTKESEKAELYAEVLHNKRKRKGVTFNYAMKLIQRPNYFGSMMVEVGDADTLIGGINSFYPTTIKPALECVGVKEGVTKVSALHIVIRSGKVYFFADTSVNISPNADELAQIAISAADTVKGFDVEPKVAMLSFSDFGSVLTPESVKVKEAARIVNERRPDIICDGEMQVATALQPELLKNEFKFSKLQGRANVLIFPNLSAGNIAYKLMENLSSASVFGPILMGMNKPIHVLQRNASIDDIINMTAIAVVEASGV